MLEAQTPAASIACHAKDGEWFDVGQPEGGGRRLKHMRDGRSDDGRMADSDDVTALLGLRLHPASDALPQVKKALAAMRGRLRLGHPGHEVFRLFRLDRLDRPASPTTVIAVAERWVYPPFEKERVGRLAGAQGGAGDNTIRVRERSDPGCFFHCLFFQRFVERKPGLAVRRRRAVADPGEARIHGCSDLRGWNGDGLCRFVKFR